MQNELIKKTLWTALFLFILAVVMMILTSCDESELDDFDGDVDGDPVECKTYCNSINYGVGVIANGFCECLHPSPGPGIRCREKDSVCWYKKAMICTSEGWDVYEECEHVCREYIFYDDVHGLRTSAKCQDN